VLTGSTGSPNLGLVDRPFLFQVVAEEPLSSATLV
jgi:hypothetical protein